MNNPTDQKSTNGAKFTAMGAALGALTQEKNEAYGDSFARSGEIMAILYPHGIAPDQYLDALGVVRVIDKLFRIATRKNAFGESPWKDIAGYGIVAAVSDGSTRLPPPSPVPSFAPSEPIPYQVVTDADAEPNSATMCPPTKDDRNRFAVETSKGLTTFPDLDSALSLFEMLKAGAPWIRLFRDNEVLASFDTCGAQ